MSNADGPRILWSLGHQKLRTHIRVSANSMWSHDSILVLCLQTIKRHVWRYMDRSAESVWGLFGCIILFRYFDGSQPVLAVMDPGMFHLPSDNHILGQTFHICSSSRNRPIVMIDIVKARQNIVCSDLCRRCFLFTFGWSYTRCTKNREKSITPAMLHFR